MRTVLIPALLVALAPCAVMAQSLGVHPAIAGHRVQPAQGYDYASKMYPHPAWLYLLPKRRIRSVTIRPSSFTNAGSRRRRKRQRQRGRTRPRRSRRQSNWSLTTGVKTPGEPAEHTSGNGSTAQILPDRPHASSRQNRTA